MTKARNNRAKAAARPKHYTGSEIGREFTKMLEEFRADRVREQGGIVGEHRLQAGAVHLDFGISIVPSSITLISSRANSAPRLIMSDVKLWNLRRSRF